MSRAFVFPGQGSQAVGMGSDLAQAFATARDIFQEVDEALKQNLSKLMREGPESDLILTENAQPALMAVSMAVARILEKDGGKPIVALARPKASSRSGRTAHGTYWTTSRGGGRPAPRAEASTASTACRVNSGGHMLEIISPSAMRPHSANARSPRAAISNGRSARRGLNESFTPSTENTEPL